MYADLGHWAEAVADFARAAELTGPADPTPWDSLALAQLGRGDTAAYRKTCARMLAMFGRTPPLIWAGGAFAAGPFNPWGAPRLAGRRPVRPGPIRSRTGNGSCP